MHRRAHTDTTTRIMHVHTDTPTHTHRYRQSNPFLMEILCHLFAVVICVCKLNACYCFVLIWFRWLFFANFVSLLVNFIWTHCNVAITHSIVSRTCTHKINTSITRMTISFLCEFFSRIFSVKWSCRFYFCCEFWFSVFDVNSVLLFWSFWLFHYKHTRSILSFTSYVYM